MPQIQKRCKLTIQARDRKLSATDESLDSNWLKNENRAVSFG